VVDCEEISKLGLRADVACADYRGRLLRLLDNQRRNFHPQEPGCINVWIVTITYLIRRRYQTVEPVDHLSSGGN